MKKTKIALIGSSDLAIYMTHYLEQDNFSVVGYFDDYQPSDMKVNGKPILGRLDQIKAVFLKKVFDQAFIAIGYKHMEFRKKLFNQFKSEIPFATFSHKSNICDKSVSLGPGSFLSPGCILDRNVSIDENCFLNPGITLAHDTKVGSHCFFAPGVTLAGFVTVGEGCFFGIRSAVINNLTLSDNNCLSAGAILTKSTTKEGLYLGLPAKHAGPWPKNL